MTDENHPWGIGHYPKVDYLTEVTDEAVGALVAAADRMCSRWSQLLVCPLGGAVARMDRGAMALNMPDAKWVCFILASWWDRRGHEQHIAWARDVMGALRPWAADAAPPNFIGDDEPGRLRRFYGDQKYRRLIALKDAYDPHNVFALNQNIPPSITSAAR
jgi:FAD/FMN-containing dehydrogenase